MAPMESASPTGSSSTSGSFQGTTENALFDTDYITRHWLIHGHEEAPDSIDPLDITGFLRWRIHSIWTMEITELMLGVTVPGNEIIKERTENLTQEIRHYLLQEDPRLEGIQPLLNSSHRRTWESIMKETEMKLSAARNSLERALHRERNYELEVTPPRQGVSTYSLQELSGDNDESELKSPTMATRMQLKQHISSALGEVMALIYVNINAERSTMAEDAAECFSMELPRELLSYTPEQRYIIGDALYHIQDRINAEDERYISIAMEHFHSLSWDVFLAFGTMVEEYNEEWALASFDWSGKAHRS